MKNKADMPQWLKDVMERGFAPKIKYKLPKDCLFASVAENGQRLSFYPSKLIFTLEGLPGSGKTSILSYFKQSAFEINCVDQILPYEPKRNKGVEFFMRSDSLKTKNSISGKFRLSLLDRYYVSTLAFYWARDRVLAKNNYPRVLAWYKKAITRGELIKPFVVFKINTPVEKSFLRKRRVPDNEASDVWLRFEFLGLCQEYVSSFYQKIEPKTKVVEIDGNQPLDKVIKRIEKIISKYV